MYGNTVSATESALAITKKITSIYSFDDAPQTGFEFNFLDDTSAQTVSIDPHTATNDVKMCLPGNFIGFKCSWRKTSSADPDSLNGCGAWYDAAALTSYTSYTFNSSISN